VADNDNDSIEARLDRLITAQEAQTNMLGRLVQLMLEEKRRKLEAKAPSRSRRATPVTPESKIAVTPLVQARVKRALARLGK
jgi:hypothetical protein